MRGQQLELIPQLVSLPPLGNSACMLQAALSQQVGKQVDLHLTNNRRSMVTWRESAAGVRLRLHRMFVASDEGTVRALANYIRRGDRRSSTELSHFIRLHEAWVEAPKLPLGILRTLGHVYDLQELFALINRQHFEGRVEAHVSWGNRPRPSRRAHRSIRLGTYCPQRCLIRLHPVLDQAWVPQFFVAYVMFHEMLHHVMPSAQRGDDRVFHTPQFRAAERAYPDYAAAIAWQQKNLDRLLRSSSKLRSNE